KKASIIKAIVPYPSFFIPVLWGQTPCHFSKRSFDFSKRSLDFLKGTAILDKMCKYHEYSF
ncbi:MAG: hypothetical protein LBQ77_08390, partial [Treponema sp.]|nr:hypothetical protein [Treponema sp.]